MTLSNKLVIDEIIMPNSSSIEINFTVPQEIKRFFLDQCFFASYNINIENVPKSILVIPFLTNVLPVAWAIGIDIYVDEIDAEFNEAVNALKKALTQLYPKLIKGNSKLIPNKIVVNKKDYIIRTSQLFSGGLDSLATLIRRIHERPFLITVCGADVKLNEIESWKVVQEHTKKIAEKFYTDVLFVKSNFKEFLDHQELGKEFGSIVSGWWTGVQHGMGLCGLSAPLTYEKGITKFYIASSHTTDYKLPYGSHPSIDNEMKWGFTKVVHESYELTRQQKVNIIANFIRTDYPTLKIRVCWKTGSNGRNCSKCEKCSRTIVGLLLEGLNPNTHGFEVDDDFTWFLKKQFESKEWRLDEAVVFQWKDIQARIPSDINLLNKQYKELFMWIRTFKFKKYDPGLLLKTGGNVAKIFPTKQKSLIKKIIGIEGN